MAHGFVESPHGLQYGEHISLPLRLFVGTIGLAMCAIPVPFLRPLPPGLPWWQWLLAGACAVLPALLGLLFLCIALGRCLRLRFDPARRQMLRTSRWPLGARDVPIGYACLAPPDVQERWSEDGPCYIVRLAVQGERPMHLGGFGARDDAEHWRGRIAAQLGGA